MRISFKHGSGRYVLYMDTAIPLGLIIKSDLTLSNAFQREKEKLKLNFYRELNGKYNTGAESKNEDRKGTIFI